jgi:hypothetical protein
MKPWDYPIAVAIPHLNTPEPLRVIVELYRRQTIRPFLLITDTGSPPDVREQLESMRAEDLEVFSVAANGYRHPSEPVTLANDLMQSRCQSERLIFTHADVFPERRDLVEMLIQRCTEQAPIVGYKMTARDADSLKADADAAGIQFDDDVYQRARAHCRPGDTDGMVGHSLLCCWMDTIDRIGATWSMRRAVRIFGLPWFGSLGWPDTECTFNFCLKQAGIEPDFLGDERNFLPTRDINIFHVRNTTGSKVYGFRAAESAIQGWLEEAMARARRHLQEWERNDQ